MNHSAEVLRTHVGMRSMCCAAHRIPPTYRIVTPAQTKNGRISARLSITDLAPHSGHTIGDHRECRRNADHVTV